MGRDHVPPACLYPPSKRAQGNLQLITIPACRSCNGGYSDDEAHFRNVMLMAGASNEAVQELWEKTWRSFREVDGERRATEIRRMMVPVKVSGEDKHMIFPGRDEMKECCEWCERSFAVWLTTTASARRFQIIACGRTSLNILSKRDCLSPSRSAVPSMTSFNIGLKSASTMKSVRFGT